MNSIFSPKTKVSTVDVVSDWFYKLAHYILIFTFGFLPIFFIPNTAISLDFNKTFFVTIGSFLALFLLVLASLRRGKLRIKYSVSLCLFWCFSLWTLVLSVLSEDKTDSLFGNGLEVQTAGFFIISAVVMTLSFVLAKNKRFITQLLTVLSFASVSLIFLQVARIFFGVNFLNLESLSNSSETLIGSLNNLAIFGGLIVIICLTLLQDLGRKNLSKLLIISILLASLFLLLVINFSVVWYVVGFFSFLFLVHSFLKDTWLNKKSLERVPVVALVSSFFVVCLAVISITNIGNFNDFVNSKTGVSYTEVVPATGLTLGILQAVYSENAFSGVGPNRFEDAWRLFKNPVINQTNYWNVDFLSGSSLALTLFITTGVVGGVTFLAFFFSLLFTSYRALFSKHSLEEWYGVGVVVFISALYLWFMVFVYNPNTVIVLLASLMTGLAIALTKNNLIKEEEETVVDVTKNKQLAPAFLIFVTIVIVGGAYFCVNISKQFFAQINYQKALQVWTSSKDFNKTDEFLIKAENLFSADIFSAERAKIRLYRLNYLLSLEETSEDEVALYQENLVEGLTLSKKAISLDSTNPYNYLLQINFYKMLDFVNNNEIQVYVETSLEKLQELDPTNVDYKILKARFFIDKGDFEKAKEILNKAIVLKNNHTETFLILAQLYIKEGKTEGGISEVTELLKIEKNNPARYLQLGVLLSSLNKSEEAVTAFKKAVELDSKYADARYFLALTLVNLNRKKEALEQLYRARENNANNRELLNLIEDLEGGL